MASARSLLRQVTALKQGHAPRRTPIEIAYGSMEAFAATTMAEMEAGKLDSVDVPVVLQCLRNWHRDRVWGGWEQNRNGVWESR